MIERVIICPARYQAQCDAPNCESGEGPRLASSVEKAREEATAIGWTGDGTGKCYCSKHRRETA